MQIFKESFDPETRTIYTPFWKFVVAMEVSELATFFPNTLYTSSDKPLLFKISVPLKETPLSVRTLFTLVTTAT